MNKSPYRRSMLGETWTLIVKLDRGRGGTRGSISNPRVEGSEGVIKSGQAPRPLSNFRGNKPRIPLSLVCAGVLSSLCLVPVRAPACGPEMTVVVDLYWERACTDQKRGTNLAADLGDLRAGTKYFIGK